MKVYVVTTGEYSDYSIHSIWSIRELAEQCVNGLKQLTYYGANDVEEYEVDGEKLPIPVKQYRAKINLVTGDLFWEKEDKPEVVESIGKRGEAYFPHPTAQSTTANVLSWVSQEHANKLAVEARQKWLRNKSLRAIKIGEDAVAIEEVYE